MENFGNSFVDKNTNFSIGDNLFKCTFGKDSWSMRALEGK